MMDYSKGPWRHGLVTGYAANSIFCDTVGGESAVCSVYGIPLHHTVDEINDDPRWREGRENARLIAAAPDLYEALKEAQAALVEGGPKSPRDALWQKISNALARAEGKQ